MKRMLRWAGILTVVIVAAGGCKSGGGGTISGGGGGGGRKIFVLATPTNGAFGSLAAGDALCASAAAGASLTGTFKAWLSDSTTDAISRINDVGPWYATNGTTLLFANKAAMTGAPAAGIELTETGASIGGSYPVWTGTIAGGTKDSALCSNWSNSGSTGQVGATQSATSGWTQQSAQSCSANAHLYCIEQ